MSGSVTLVGAGPGNRDLLTIGGMEAICQAEVVLYDQLVGSDILGLIPADAQRVDVGKRSNHHPVPQEEINQMILAHAQQGKRVVRLKGGDPYLFGRGAEELELLGQHGIPFRVMPGITSPLAVPAYAGIPVTHRDYASSVHILTGHGKRGEPPKIDYRELVGLSGTLVFLMGVSALEDICSGLLGAGMAPDMPAALVENGTTPRQRRVVSTLRQLPGEARQQGVKPPAVLVVGRVCTLAHRMDFTRFMPLWGREVLTCSSRTTGSKLAARLCAAGARVTEFASIEMTPLDGQDPYWQKMNTYGWVVFTSVYGAQQFFEELASRRLDIRSLAGIRFAAIGSESARVLEARGILVDYLPEVYNAERLAEGLVQRVAPGQTVLLYRAREGTEALTDILVRSGVRFEECPAYRTGHRPPDDTGLLGRLRDGAYDFLTFTSASAVKGLATVAGDDCLGGVQAVCIGQSTAAAAKALGMRVKTSPKATVAEMAKFIEEEYGNGTDV